MKHAEICPSCGRKKQAMEELCFNCRQVIELYKDEDSDQIQGFYPFLAIMHEFMEHYPRNIFNNKTGDIGSTFIHNLRHAKDEFIKSCTGKGRNAKKKRV